MANFTVAAAVDTFLQSADAAAMRTALGGICPRSYLAGLGLANNGSDATNDIDIAVGTCRNSTNTADITLAAAITKRLDADWAAGTGNGMRNSAAAIANGTYHIYLVSTAAGTTDIYAYAGVAGTDPQSSASYSAVIAALQAESGGSSYVNARRIGSIQRISAAIQLCLWLGDDVEPITPTFDVNVTNQSTSSVSYTVSVPLGLKLPTKFNFGWSNASVTIAGYLRDPDTADLAPSTSAAPGQTVRNPVAGQLTVGQQTHFTNTSGQVAARALAATTTLQLTVLSWVDKRGRDN